jgi:hypothetical protein
MTTASDNSYNEGQRRTSNVFRKDAKDFKPLYAKYGHQMYNLKIPYLSSLPATPFTGSQSTIEFEIKAADNYYLLNDDSIWLYMKLTETGNSASVTPTFAECLFDKNASFEWLMNGSRSLCTPYPMLQTVLHPAVELSQNQYEQMCNLLNHNIYLSHGSQTALQASGVAVYWLRVPNPLPSKKKNLNAFRYLHIYI